MQKKCPFTGNAFTLQSDNVNVQAFQHLMQRVKLKTFPMSTSNGTIRVKLESLRMPRNTRKCKSKDKNVIFENKNCIQVCVELQRRLKRKRKLDAADEYTLPMAKLETVDTSILPVRIGLLNFASKMAPGGGVLRGRGSQEEEIYRSTDMCAKVGKDVYPLRDDCFLFTSGVKIMQMRESGSPHYCPVEEENMFIDVLSISAPHHPSVSMSLNESNNEMIHGYAFDEDREVMVSKVDGLFKQFIHAGCRHIVLGALGCGINVNPCHDVAHIFKKALDVYKDFFESITFAILDTDTRTLDIFERIISGKVETLQIVAPHVAPQTDFQVSTVQNNQNAQDIQDNYEDVDMDIDDEEDKIDQTSEQFEKEMKMVVSDNKFEVVMERCHHEILEWYLRKLPAEHIRVVLELFDQLRTKYNDLKIYRYQSHVWFSVYHGDMVIRFDCQNIRLWERCFVFGQVYKRDSKFDYHDENAVKTIMDYSPKIFGLIRDSEKGQRIQYARIALENLLDAFQQVPSFADMSHAADSIFQIVAYESNDIDIFSDNDCIRLHAFYNQLIVIFSESDVVVKYRHNFTETSERYKYTDVSMIQDTISSNLNAVNMNDILQLSLPRQKPKLDMLVMEDTYREQLYDYLRRKCISDSKIIQDLVAHFRIAKVEPLLPTFWIQLLDTNIQIELTSYTVNVHYHHGAFVVEKFYYDEDNIIDKVMAIIEPRCQIPGLPLKPMEPHSNNSNESKEPNAFMDLSGAKEPEDAHATHVECPKSENIECDEHDMPELEWLPHDFHFPKKVSDVPQLACDFNMVFQRFITTDFLSNAKRVLCEWITLLISSKCDFDLYIEKDEILFWTSSKSQELKFTRTFIEIKVKTKDAQECFKTGYLEDSSISKLLSLAAEAFANSKEGEIKPEDEKK